MSCAAGGPAVRCLGQAAKHTRGCVVNDGSERTTVVLVAPAGATMRQAFPDAGSGLLVRTGTARRTSRTDLNPTVNSPQWTGEI